MKGGAMRLANERRNRGFSLIELVIVVVIIGIIAAIAIPRLSRGAAGAADAALIGDTVMTLATSSPRPTDPRSAKGR